MGTGHQDIPDTLLKRRTMSQTLDDYRAAIGEQFPSVLMRTLDSLSEGWESVACLVNEHLVFLFPKREMGAPIGHGG